MSESIMCIGPMIHGWYAELRFDDSEATVRDRDRKGEPVVATVPLGCCLAETKDEDACLVPGDEQNKNLMAILAVPRMLAALRFCEKKLGPRENRADADILDPDDWRDDSEMLREVQEALEYLDVPTD